ncbi:MAG: hypothetical protein K2X03_27935 [Bryobacteraceae bacterium]|nr:hypothetical protein [Bryobacteraceae bacterium]
MPWPNRVNPFGEFEAVPQRGLFFGNRGCLINAKREFIKTFQLERWITCVLEFKGRRHPVMTPGLFTELFFLDEATAFAAGHRPCAECRRPDAYRFLALWNQANGQQVKRLTELDHALHLERLQPSHELTLANGVFVAVERTAYLHLDGCFYPWSPSGYSPAVTLSAEPRQLTPPSIARALAAGYQPFIHQPRSHGAGTAIIGVPYVKPARCPV